MRWSGWTLGGRELVASLVLHDLCQLDYAQIAEHLAIPMGTLKSRIHDACRQVRVLLQDVDRRGGELDVAAASSAYPRRPAITAGCSRCWPTSTAGTDDERLPDGTCWNTFGARVPLPVRHPVPMEGFR